MPILGAAIGTVATGATIAGTTGTIVGGAGLALAKGALGGAILGGIAKGAKKTLTPGLPEPPTAPTVALPPALPAPKATDPEVERRKRDQRLAARLRSGRQQTILTGPQGVPSPATLSTTLG
jgi:hypothetical protein